MKDEEKATQKRQQIQKFALNDTWVLQPPSVVANVAFSSFVTLHLTAFVTVWRWEENVIQGAVPSKPTCNVRPLLVLPIFSNRKLSGMVIL